MNKVDALVDYVLSTQYKCIKNMIEPKFNIFVSRELYDELRHSCKFKDINEFIKFRFMGHYLYVIEKGEDIPDFSISLRDIV